MTDFDNDLLEKLRQLIVETVVLNRADDRLPLPCDIHAEQRLVASAMRGFKRPTWCKPEHFYEPFHQCVLLATDALTTKPGEAVPLADLADLIFKAGFSGEVCKELEVLLEVDRLPHLMAADAQAVSELWRIREFLVQIAVVDALGRSKWVPPSEVWAAAAKLMSLLPPRVRAAA